MLNILSLGAGVQSSVVLMKSIHGELPPLDHVVFADVGWEPHAVYTHMEFLTAKCEEAGIGVHVVSAGNIRDDMLGVHRDGHTTAGLPCVVTMPFWLRNADGTTSRLRRQCTRQYKLAPMAREVRRLAGLRPRQRSRKTLIRQWLGFSWDEVTRMCDPFFSWIDHYYPLIETRMTRDHCIDWWARHYPRQPLTKSSCIGCPFRDDAGWIRMQDEAPGDFIDAVSFERQLQSFAAMGLTNPRLRDAPYIHKSCVPLGDVQFVEPVGHPLFAGVEMCSADCGT